MKRYLVIIILFISVDSVAQTEVADSIGKHLSLDEVVISASNITRVDNHLIIFPNEQQRKHTNNGYGILKNLMIPGLIVNSQSGYVEAMGMQASLYINGQECDAKEVRMIRPRDIEKIEYYDAPTGKYAKDQVAINFVLKQYKYGGYFHEQQAIVEYIDAKLSKINQYMADLQAEIDYLKEFKQRLISDAVTGQICVAKPQKGDAQ